MRIFVHAFTGVALLLELVLRKGFVPIGSRYFFTALYKRFVTRMYVHGDEELHADPAVNVFIGEALFYFVYGRRWTPVSSGPIVRVWCSASHPLQPHQGVKGRMVQLPRVPSARIRSRFRLRIPPIGIGWVRALLALWGRWFSFRGDHLSGSEVASASDPPIPPQRWL